MDLSSCVPSFMSLLSVLLSYGVDTQGRLYTRPAIRRGRISDRDGDSQSRRTSGSQAAGSQSTGALITHGLLYILY